ncbi:aminoglycoside phosphotransferase family protein [Shewanella surugensis]|uniref:Aminoglycoside phosphotransferase family protein n=1 Tax=Shewanella surugensis TaxID=212020 RepID=A0ABT0L7Z0_9GAMM|nr:aminoglycoside phosphotransferase family protein [Shewanella surugensis]MCL1123791.1 aminoglycoside phosphotransferase family protein [Shewanella surugensis]
MTFRHILFFITAVYANSSIASNPIEVTERSVNHPYDNTFLSIDEQLQRDQIFINCIDQTEKSTITEAKVLYSEDENSNALYLIKKRHSSGAGGGLVFKVIKNPNVWGKSDKEEVRLLKIFPYSKSSLIPSRNFTGASLEEANRERLNLCVMTKLDAQMHQASAPDEAFPSTFPIYEHMGMTYVSTHSQAVPFIVTDYVSGKPLSEFYFDQESFTSTPHHETYADFLQWLTSFYSHPVYPEQKRDKAAYSVFLQLLTSLKTANEKYGFQHYDLHPGNIIISNENWPKGTYLNSIHPISKANIQIDISETPKVKIIDLGTSGIGIISATDAKFLDRKITKALTLRAKSSSFKYYFFGNRVAKLTPDLSMWYIIANHVIENETTLEWNTEEQNEFICNDYASCLAGFLDRAAPDFVSIQ